MRVCKLAISLLFLVVLFFSTSHLVAQATAPQRSEGSWSIDALDKTADPCVDFYQFACGGWKAKNPIPADRSAWGTGSALAERNTILLHTLLENAAKNDAKRTAVETRVGDFYAACMDEQKIDSQGLAPLQPELARIAKLKSKNGLPAEIAHLHLLGLRDWTQIAGQGRAKVLFDLQGLQDDKDAEQLIAIADAGGIALPDRDFYVAEDNKEMRDQYLEHVTNMFKLLGDKPEPAAENAKAVLAIETDLAKASMTKTDRRDPQRIYHKMSIADLQALTPSFSWKQYFSALKVTAPSSLNVREPDFFKGVNAAIGTHPLEHWQSYLRWHLVHFAAPQLPQAFVDENFDFYGKKLTGAKQLRARWKRCVQLTDASLGEQVGQLYTAKAFGPESQARMLALVHNIEAAMDDDIKNLDWMGAETKKQALIKLKAIANKIGAPEKSRSYDTVTTNRSTALANYFSAGGFDFQWALNRIGKPVDRSEWQMSPSTVNAYYDPQMNNINFPAGILQPPFFDAALDDAVNYGAIGGVIGHEITHGFDDQGRQYDAQGNLKEWWTAEDGKRFQERADCIVKEYDQFTTPNPSDPTNAAKAVHLNGKLTLGENAADNGGLRLAYLALQKANAGKSVAAIDGFTPEQRVFLGWGQGWCANFTDKAAALQAKTNEHSLAKYRVNGVVQNMPEFQQAYGCKKGQPMVSEHACRIW